MFDVSPFSMAARKFCLWHQEETRRRLRGGRLEAFFRPPFLLAGTVERFKAGDEKLGRLQLRRNVECSHCACMAAARQEHSIDGLRVNCVSNQGFLRQYFVSGFFATALGKVFIATVPRVFFHTVSPEPVFLWTSARCCLLRWCFLRQ